MRIALKIGNYFVLNEINIQDHKNDEQIRNFNAWLS